MTVDLPDPPDGHFWRIERSDTAFSPNPFYVSLRKRTWWGGSEMVKILGSSEQNIPQKAGQILDAIHRDRQMDSIVGDYGRKKK